MCGIVGFSGHTKEGQWGQTHAILSSLFIASQHRGRHATGFVAQTAPFKQPNKTATIIAKQQVPASTFVDRNMNWLRLRHQRCQSVVGHVRWATHGTPKTAENNHPFSSDDGRSHVVHNGIIERHQDVARMLGLRLTSECDSEVILRLVETAQSPQDGLEDALSILRGSLAIVLLDAQDGSLYFARNDGRPLWLSQLDDGRWFFASQRAILSSNLLGKAIRQIFPLAAQHVYRLDRNGSLTAGSRIDRGRHSRSTLW